MKKLFMTAMALCALGGLSAQTILNEGFETGNMGNDLTPVASGEGWETVDGYKGDNPRYRWHNYFSLAESESGATITGNCCASVDAPFTLSEGDGVGPREEILLSPTLDLNDTYQLQFTFRVSPMNSYENSRYDIQVRVVEDGNLAGAETIFSIQNEKMLRDAGITVSPISNWNPYTARVDLSDFKGEKVRLAFVYKMYAETANVVWLDDITVSRVAPVTGPIASANVDRHDFGTLYIGEKCYSNVITLTNSGKDGLRVTGTDLPAGVSLNKDLSGIELQRYQHVDFQLAYEASLTSAADGAAVIHTNGGDITINFSAKKQFVPEGHLLETFEGYFPPAGWNNNGWTATAYALEGDQSVYCGGGFGVCSIRSPRLDLTEGGSVTFTYFNQYDEDGYPEYDVELQVSYDGGDNWITKWVSDYENGLNQVLTETVDLGYGSDTTYVRWMYPMVESDDEGAFPHSTFYLDRVLLPSVYGMDGVPQSAKVISPANNATDIYPRNVKLEWAPAQFAEGYKLYVGTDSAASDLINGLDLGNALSYTIPECQYETTYRWKVIGYNEKGNASSLTSWKFTTQKDASVSEYPYEENFLSSGLPTGWVSTPSESTPAREWYVNTIHNYKDDGKEYGVLTSYWLYEGYWNAVNTQEFLLPEDRNMSISFIWGDEHPADLVVDPTGTERKQNVEPNNGVSETFFEIYADGAWTTLSTLSENSFDGERKYWHAEKCDLSAYRGKKVTFRWRHVSYSGKDDGSSLTHIVLAANEGQNAYLNKERWDAGKVNFNKATNSGRIFSLINDGTDGLKVKAVSFETPNFSCSLEEGQEIGVGEIAQFDLTFEALETAKPIEDLMTIEFESGYKLEMPVSGEALAKTTYYYSFEPNPLDLNWEEEFTMIDADNAINYGFSTYWIHYSKDSQKGAFSAESDSKEDGMYGMMKPVSGLYALVGASPQNTSADNWIISRRMLASENSKFDFYARNWETLNSVLPSPNHHVTVYVSEEGNATTSAFNQTAMRDTEMAFLGEGEWHHFEVDLSKWAGKEIYVALRHTTTGASNLAFFDDFRFTNMDTEGSGIAATELGSDSDVEIFSVAGIRVATGKASQVKDLAKGLYIVRSTENGKTTTRRIVVK